MLRATVASAVLVLSVPFAALAEEGGPNVPPGSDAEARTPVDQAGVRETALPLDRYERSISIVRKRTEGKTYATFSAEPRLLDQGSMIEFEVYSVAQTGVVPRWRCIATRDVAECLGSPLKIRYLPSDDQIVMRAKVKPIQALEAVASR